MGPGGGNAAYRSQGLQFRPVEVNLDESVSFRSLLDLALRAFAVALLLWLLFVSLALLLLVFGSTSGPAAVLVIGSVVAGMAFWVVLLLSQTSEPVSEWRMLIEDKSQAAASAYAVIYGSLSRRRIPVNSAAVRVRTDILNQEIVNNRLTISDREYVAYVSVFEYGTSLYVGWSMFRLRRGFDLIVRFLKDVVGGFVGRSDLIAQMLRADRPRAMREAVHSAVREGVEVAIQGIEVPIAATFGYDVEIRPISGATAPPSVDRHYGAGPAPASRRSPDSGGPGSDPPPPTPGPES
jgi:hypothetical protein